MKKILLVEDNAANRKLLGDIMKRAGYEVVAVENADDALALAFAGGFDLAVMDIQLPGTDGLTTTKMLRADDRTSAMPVLAVTAHAMRGDEERVLDAGCDGYVSKPVAYKEFLNEIQRLLSAGRSPRQA